MVCSGRSILENQSRSLEIALSLTLCSNSTKCLTVAYCSEFVLCLSDLLLGAQEDCGLTVEESSNYPHCNGKMAVSSRRIYLLVSSVCEKNVSVGTGQVTAVSHVSH